MANPWFRMYSEFATDPKVQMLSESDQRRLTMLFCLRCNGNVTLQDEEVTFLLRISNDEWNVTKALFLSKGFINDSNEILNWDKRQYISDSSAERVARHRASKKELVTPCNVTVTPPEQIQNRTETDNTIVPFSKSRFNDFWKTYPSSSRKVAKAACEKKWKAKRLDAIAEKIITHVKAIQQSQQWADGFAPAPLTYINQERWGDDIHGDDVEQPEWKRGLL